MSCDIMQMQKRRPKKKPPKKPPKPKPVVHDLQARINSVRAGDLLGQVTTLIGDSMTEKVNNLSLLADCMKDEAAAFLIWAENTREENKDIELQPSTRFLRDSGYDLGPYLLPKMPMVENAAYQKKMDKIKLKPKEKKEEKTKQKNKPERLLGEQIQQYIDTVLGVGKQKGAT